ncbi:Thiol-disulfide isomerase or thioredoxin [Mesobacillus persicus]|uniref:Thiol-disulfide isomerase or thioredoxin n=1 Tax=Mesobacillus persicus TaxID=930146 RepID=A0A1H7XZH6_9BACI|nr:thioredoxin family protein [Mesobacillus persicus]SEM39123.1 Thiol-disulfide isomerase or thioredoxin [Mesobacillus persicus]
MKKLESIEQFNTIKNNGKHLFLFSANWCPDCRFIDPFLPELEQKFNEFTFVYIDRDEHIDLCVELNVFGIPSFLAYKDGEELGRFVSKERKTQEQIEEFIGGLDK